MYNKPNIDRLEGNWVTLEKLDKTKHSKDIFEVSLRDEHIFDYLSFGPYNNISEFENWIDLQYSMVDRLPFAVYSKRLKKYVGTLSITFIEEKNAKAEIGCVWYGKEFQKSEINRESVYLLLKYLFEDLSYVRVQWRCNSENLRSKTSAEKMGFIYEGCFRNYGIFKGKVRDTLFFSITDYEWSKVKENFIKNLLKEYKND